jgi:hypothetical protein
MYLAVSGTVKHTEFPDILPKIELPEILLAKSHDPSNWIII